MILVIVRQEEGVLTWVSCVEVVNFEVGVELNAALNSVIKSLWSLGQGYTPPIP